MYTIFYMILNAYTIILLVLVLALIALTIQVVLLQKRITALTRGKDAKSLEETIRSVITDIKKLEGDFGYHDNQIAVLEQKAAKSIQGLGTIRFNPFKNGGGNQSFATAFVNEHGDGVIISTLYGRERVSLFAKPLIAWKSEFELTPEEETALRTARDYQSKN